MKYKFTELSEHSDEHVKPIASYLNFLIEGDGKKAHCPFTKPMLIKKQFYYDTSDELISADEFLNSLNQMKDFHQQIGNRFTVVGVVYDHAQNFTIETAQRVESYRQSYRLDFIASGLTIAWTHPKNDLGTHTNKEKPNYPLWVSEVPMLMLRSLDKGDEPFMITAEAKQAFDAGIKIAEERHKKKECSFPNCGCAFTKEVHGYGLLYWEEIGGICKIDGKEKSGINTVLGFI